MLSRFTLLMCVVGVLSAELHKVRRLRFVKHWQIVYVKLMRKFKKKSLSIAFMMYCYIHISVKFEKRKR